MSIRDRPGRGLARVARAVRLGRLPARRPAPGGGPRRVGGRVRHRYLARPPCRRPRSIGPGEGRHRARHGPPPRGHGRRDRIGPRDQGSTARAQDTVQDRRRGRRLRALGERPRPGDLVPRHQPRGGPVPLGGSGAPAFGGRPRGGCRAPTSAGPRGAARQRPRHHRVPGHLRGAPPAPRRPGAPAHPGTRGPRGTGRASVPGAHRRARRATRSSRAPGSSSPTTWCSRTRT